LAIWRQVESTDPSATKQYKGDASECSCPNCNTAEDDFEKQDE